MCSRKVWRVGQGGRSGAAGLGVRVVPVASFLSTHCWGWAAFLMHDSEPPAPLGHEWGSPILQTMTRRQEVKCMPSRDSEI